MARCAIQFAAWPVLRMLEVYCEGTCPIRISRRPADLMANIARANIPASDLGFRLVTLKTRHVSIDAGRDRESYALPRRFMARCTICLSAMHRMRKLDAETPQRRKTLQAGFGMADTADRTLIVGELLNVATGTRQMPGKFH